MSSQTPVKGGRTPAPSIPGGKRMPLNSPLPNRPGGRRWWLWLILLPLLLLGVTYLLGRTVEQVRVRLEPVPLVGKLLFKAPVWPVLWNKAPEASKVEEPAGQAGSKAPADSAKPPAADVSALEAEVAARLAALEVKENEIKKREAGAAAREQALKTREQSIATQEKTLGAEIKALEELRKQLEGQRRSDLDRVEVVRNMKSAAVLQLFAAMTDDEVLRVLMYMDASEVGKHLSGMDPYRSARLLTALRQVAPASAP